MTRSAPGVPSKKSTPHGLPFAPVKVGVLIDIDMGTIALCQKGRASA